MSRSKASASSSPIFKIQDEDRFYLNDDFIEQYKNREPKWGPVGKIAYVRTYARELRGEELVQFLMRDMKMSRKEARAAARQIKSKREEFWQTARRVVEFAWTVFQRQARMSHHAWNSAEAQEKAQEMFRRLWDFKWLPPGRGMQFAGTPVVEIKGGAVLNNCGFLSTQYWNDTTDRARYSEVFGRFMDFLMLGVGMGSDVRGAKAFVVTAPGPSEGTVCVVGDSREEWVDALRCKLNQYFCGSSKCEWDFSSIRKAGAPLKTLGGTASGSAPLERLLARIDEILKPLINHPITQSAITDIFNEIGVCVVSGNIRRSAEIMIGENGDHEFAALKDPSDIVKWSEEREDEEDSVPEIVRIKRRIASLRKKQVGLSAANAMFIYCQDKIDRAQARIQKIAQQNPEWVRLTANIMKHPLNTHRWASNNTQLFEVDDDFTEVAKQIATNGEPGVAFLGNIQNFGRIGDNLMDLGAVGFNPCAEQPLEDGELCCLGELNPNAHESLEDFLATIKYAYMYCKAVTLVPTHDQATNKIMTKNRRIGLSMMGIWKMYERLGMQECIYWWERGYAEVRHWDKTYSEWLGVNESIKVTSVKPGGTIPLLVGEEGGMKIPTAKYYFRTIRMDHTSPLAKACKDAGYRVEKDRTSPRTVVVYFPVFDESTKRTAEDVSMWEQMGLLAELQAHWSDNMVSNTITFQPLEASEIAQAIAMFAHRIKAVSFLPLMTHGYAQAPYIPIEQWEYELAAAKIGSLDLTKGGHEVDEKYCTGDVCMRAG